MRANVPWPRAGHRCADTEILLADSWVSADYRDVNPSGFGPAVAPHLAARAVGIEIEPGRIRACFERLCTKADWVVVEGLGGSLVPLGDDNTTADLARLLGPVILVVAMKLGCLNHALLTVEATNNSSLELAGFVANEIGPAAELFRENVETLKAPIDAPLLGTIPQGGTELTPDTVTEHLDLQHLLETARRDLR